MDWLIGLVLLASVVVVTGLLWWMTRRLKAQRLSQHRIRHLKKRIGLKNQKHSLVEDFRQSQKQLWQKKIQHFFRLSSLTLPHQIGLWLFAQAATILLSTFALLFFEPPGRMSVVLLLVLPFLPGLYLYVQRIKRVKKLKQQFPEMLETMVRSLESGYAVDGALTLIAEDFSDPLGGEMKEVIKQLSVGISLREVLLAFEQRLSIPEAKFFVLTLIIQRESGGELARIINDLSQLMRRRETFTEKLKTLTAESRFTAIFIGAAPLLYIAYKYLFDPESLAFFFEDETGQQLFVVSLVLIFSGSLILRKMLRIRF
ncbi:MAG: type II secretion system F family protein [Hydrogenovibrio sp.]|uniref:type II secretion system F family protein n=1 Tax=Hydrogenovibrio sp. TaxID=2065821 RepID=UPI0028701DCB|nr:type II secretion system F family protein [Hydrogenovibrio sp.]MDR9497578.1 type II secretion system F family protein [Hydrogenovibrio sp.]